MLRILFTSDDLARTRIAAEPDPMWELVMALHMLRRQRGDLLFAAWRSASASRVRQHLDRADVSLLMELTPTLGYFPDFLTPEASALGLEAGLEAIRRTPKTLLRQDLERLGRDRTLTAPGMPGLARGETAALSDLTRSLNAVDRLVIAPHRDVIGRAVARDREVRANALLTGGVEAMLASLAPMATYRDGELCVPAHRDQTVQLDGRGLVLIPSYFNLVQPLTLLDPALQPVLVYAVPRPPDTIITNHDRPRHDLAPLIGATRLAVLQSVDDGATTSDLARRAGVAIASASEHARVLRNAGLITSQRDGNRVVHHLTPLGASLLLG